MRERADASGRDERTRSRPAEPPSSQSNLMLALQQGAGNQAVSRLIQRKGGKENNTGLPDALKAGVESLSGLAMDDVRVHFNPSKPAQLQALAYTLGSEIHVAPGQEKYLPHEAWHVVQQKQGRVSPTTALKSGAQVDDDPALTAEADAMAQKALATGSSEERLHD